jgi:hypothetical protein
MDERTVRVQLGKTELEVFAGNMAVMRYRMAGNSMQELDLLDRCFPDAPPEVVDKGDSGEGEDAPAPLSHDEILDATMVAARYLSANLVGEQRTPEELVNLAGNLAEPVMAYVMAARSMPALEGMEGEDLEEAATDSSTSGPSPSSSSDGIRTASGGLAAGSGS